MEYDKINELFEPIFQWIKEHYPNGAYFLVDKNSAQLYAEASISVYSEEIKNYAKSSNLGTVFNDIINTIATSIKQDIKRNNSFILNQDCLE